jgi:hypothetical protein
MGSPISANYDDEGGAFDVSTAFVDGGMVRNSIYSF